MNQSINTDSKNSKEPQQKYRLGTVSIKILGGGGGLNRFYGGPKSVGSNPDRDTRLEVFIYRSISPPTIYIVLRQ